VSILNGNYPERSVVEAEVFNYNRWVKTNRKNKVNKLEATP
jgi:hypothetical protein